MPHFNPLANVTGRHAYTLFEIRYVVFIALGVPDPVT